MILGIDEVGRGPWAGPLVVGAVVLGGAVIEGLTDSKKLSKKRREQLYDEIYAKASGVGLGWVTAVEIDEIGLSEALRLATRRAVQQVQKGGASFHEIIIDGTINFLSDTPFESYVSTMKKADLLVPSVSAASIVAKVARDRFMSNQDAVFLEYHFGTHVGYGTAAHREAIAKYGVTPLHRLSFAPLAKYKKTSEEVSQTSRSLSDGRNQSTRQIGDASEQAASEELVRRGHEIVARNWKTKYCEIDIISRKHDTLFFTEVKHRKNAQSGDGLAAITPKKLNQMKFAARLYVSQAKVVNYDMRLAVISTTGSQHPVVELYLELD